MSQPLKLRFRLAGDGSSQTRCWHFKSLPRNVSCSAQKCNGILKLGSAYDPFRYGLGTILRTCLDNYSILGPKFGFTVIVFTSEVLTRCLQSIKALVESGESFNRLGRRCMKLLRLKGIYSIQHLIETKPARLEAILNRNAPFGKTLLDQAKRLPCFSVGIQKINETITEEGVICSLEAIVEVSNDPPPQIRAQADSHILVCTSDYNWIAYRRIKLSKLVGVTKSFPFKVTLIKPSQRVLLVASTDLAGLAVQSIWAPDTPSNKYPVPAFDPETTVKRAANEVCH